MHSALCERDPSRPFITLNASTWSLAIVNRLASGLRRSFASSAAPIVDAFPYLLASHVLLSLSPASWAGRYRLHSLRFQVVLQSRCSYVRPRFMGSSRLLTLCGCHEIDKRSHRSRTPAVGPWRFRSFSEPLQGATSAALGFLARLPAFVPRCSSALRPGLHLSIDVSIICVRWTWCPPVLLSNGHKSLRIRYLAI